MRLLLDTHIFLWSILDDVKLSKKTRELIVHAEETYVSSASIWEIAIKKSLVKIDINNNMGKLADAIQASGFLELPITAKHASAVLDLEFILRDPFDRLLISQAICEPLIFLTSDKHLQGYSPIIKIV